jgi:hypothetical protein
MSAASGSSEIELDFTGCIFLHQHAVAILAGIIRTLQQRGCTVRARLGTINATVQENLKKNAFMKAMGLQQVAGGRNTIPFREDAVREDASYLVRLGLDAGDRLVEHSGGIGLCPVARGAQLGEASHERARPVGRFCDLPGLPKVEAHHLARDRLRPARDRRVVGERLTAPTVAERTQRLEGRVALRDQFLCRDQILEVAARFYAKGIPAWRAADQRSRVLGARSSAEAP